MQFIMSNHRMKTLFPNRCNNGVKALTGCHKTGCNISTDPYRLRRNCPSRPQRSGGIPSRGTAPSLRMAGCRVGVVTDAEASATAVINFQLNENLSIFKNICV
jgi:hypothetical protein